MDAKASNNPYDEFEQVADTDDMEGFVQQDFEAQPASGQKGFAHGEMSGAKLDDPISD